MSGEDSSVQSNNEAQREKASTWLAQFTPETFQVNGISKGYHIMATIIVATIAALCKKHRISEEQFDKATYCVANGKQGFYIVESQSEPGVEYHVTWNERYNALACTCKAGQNGVPCWHKRAASASHEHYRQEQAVRRQREQAEVEATPEYKLEQAFRELEDALDKLDEIAAKADAREQARRDAERTAYLNFELSMGI